MCCLELSKFIEQVIVTQNFWKGTRHIFSEDLNKFELVNHINKIYSLGNIVNKVDTDISIDRTLRTSFEKIFTPKPIIDQISESKEFYKSYEEIII